MTIGADGRALISYYDSFNGALEVAHCSNTLCTSAIGIDVDSTANVGQHSAITIGADGLPLIAYHDITSRNLKVVHCSNTRCVPNMRNR